MDWKRIAASVLMLGVLAVPASAASITPQTTMKEIRDDPRHQGQRPLYIHLCVGAGLRKGSPPAATTRR